VSSYEHNLFPELISANYTSKRSTQLYRELFTIHKPAETHRTDSVIPLLHCKCKISYVVF